MHFDGGLIYGQDLSPSVSDYNFKYQTERIAGTATKKLKNPNYVQSYSESLAIQ